MNADFAGILYLVAAICFILALRGLSHPTTSRAGNIYGMVGMAIAIVTTMAMPGVVSYGTILAGIVVGGAEVVETAAASIAARRSASSAAASAADAASPKAIARSTAAC